MWFAGNRYQLPVNGYVTIKVYNKLGQEVITLIEKEQAAGYYNIHWNAGNNSSGIYFCHIKVEIEKGILLEEVKKMMFIK